MCNEDGIYVSKYCQQNGITECAMMITGFPGMHCNFSNSILRTCGSQETYEKICESFRSVTKEHIDVYGEFNDQRLTGDHETASINDFSYGISDRGASIRIPIITVENNWKGWLEDRRPASNADPYKIASRIIQTMKVNVNLAKVGV